MPSLAFFLTAAVILFLVAVIVVQRRAVSQLVEENAELRRSGTALTRYGESLAARENALAEAAAEALLVISPTREIVYLNAAAREIFQDGSVGRRISEVAWGFDLTPLITDALKGRIETIQQVVVRGPRAFLARARPIGPYGEHGAVLALQDVTELQRLGRTRRDFVANISHELRSPLASIRLLVETLLKGAWRDPELGPDLLNKINAEVDGLKQLSDELFDLAQIESGQAPLRLMTANLHVLIDNALTRFILLAQNRQVTLSMAEMTDVGVLVDADKFTQVLGNLLHNAIKFTPPGGCVTVGARPSEDMVEISVQDTGPGIPAEDLPRIFERFYKVDRARSRGEKGTGLGLAIARHIVEAHGGKIWAASEQGAGATLYFTVPRA